MGISNSQYNSIISRYDARRMSAADELNSRRDYVYSHVDGYKELCDAVASLSVERTKAALSGDKNALSDLGSLIDDLSSQKKALLISAGLPEDYLTASYICNDCKDTGYINGQKCHCFKQEVLTLLYDNSNMKEILSQVDFSMISSDYYKGSDLINFNKTYEKAREFVRDFDKTYDNLLFYGTVGTGKSLMSSCIAKELLDSGHSVIYFSAIALLEALSDYTFSSGKRDDSTVNNLYECDLLIIDDLGTELINSFTISSIFNLINERFNRRKSVIISTNQTLIQLQETYTDRIFSRLSANFRFCNLTGPDIRMLKGY
ncbi:MAG: ATP-binding protein [Lachnospiraceae bacterium]|nr:ATP-binding protein [Lachnospiraceae bacterium]